MENSKKMMEKPAWGRQERRDLPIWEKQIAAMTNFPIPIVCNCSLSGYDRQKTDNLHTTTIIGSECFSEGTYNTQ